MKYTVHASTSMAGSDVEVEFEVDEAELNPLPEHHREAFLYERGLQALFEQDQLEIRVEPRGEEE